MNAPSPSITADRPLADQPSGLGQIATAIRAFLALLWLDIKRSQGYWALPVMVGVAWYASSYRSLELPGVTLWTALNNAIMQSYVVIGPVGAALGAWLAGRDRRRRLDDSLEAVPTPPIRRDLVLTLVAAAWALAAYAMVGGWFAWKGYTEATWGGPDLPLIANGALAIVLFCAVGVLAGRFLPGKLAPVLAFAVTFLPTIAVDLVKITRPVTNEFGTFVEVRQPLKFLMPWWLSDPSYPDIFYRRHTEIVSHSMLWLAGATGVVLALLALRRHRGVMGWVALAGAVGIAAAGAIPLIDRQLHPGASGLNAVVPFDWSCQQRGGFEICLHPAYDATLDATADQVAAMFGPVAGLAGVPVRWQQGSPVERQDRQQIGVIDQPGHSWALLNAMNEIFPAPEDGGPFGQRPASQLVIMDWLVRQSPTEAPFDGWFGWPAEVPVVERDYGNGAIDIVPDEPALAAFQPQMDAALERFAALPETEQRGWLEANWDALRAGDLTLDDLP